eukprot:12904136-Prorocentrum_lima.AAC.1
MESDEQPRRLPHRRASTQLNDRTGFHRVAPCAQWFSRCRVWQPPPRPRRLPHPEAQAATTPRIERTI